MTDFIAPTLAVDQKRNIGIGSRRTDWLRRLTACGDLTGIRRRGPGRHEVSWVWMLDSSTEWPTRRPYIAP